jgi:hypothetical protein
MGRLRVVLASHRVNNFGLRCAAGLPVMSLQRRTPAVGQIPALQACTFATNEAKKANGSRHPCACGCFVSEGGIDTMPCVQFTPTKGGGLPEFRRASAALSYARSASQICACLLPNHRRVTGTLVADDITRDR